MERADSLAFDLHKWMYMPYEIACVLIRNKEAQYYTKARLENARVENGVLIIVGTEGDDDVEVTREADGMLTVYASFLPLPEQSVTFKTSRVKRIEATLLAGDDRMFVASNLHRPAIIDGTPDAETAALLDVLTTPAVKAL